MLWRAKQAKILIGNALSSVNPDTDLKSQMSSAVEWSGRVKDIEIAGAEADVDSVFLFGADASGRQNAEITEEAMSMREFTGTLIFVDQDAAELALSQRVRVGSTSYYRVQGDTTRSRKAILVTFTDGTNTVNILMNNALFTKIGDISLDAEGHAEQEITAKCLAKDYYEEANFT